MLWTECVYLLPIPQFIYWNPNSQCGIIEGGDLLRWLAHEIRAPMNGISALLRSLSLLFAVWLYNGNGELATCKLEAGLSPDTESATTLILDFPDSETVVEITLSMMFCYSSPNRLRLSVPPGFILFLHVPWNVCVPFSLYLPVLLPHCTCFLKLSLLFQYPFIP